MGHSAAFANAFAFTTLQGVLRPPRSCFRSVSLRAGRLTDRFASFVWRHYDTPASEVVTDHVEKKLTFLYLRGCLAPLGCLVQVGSAVGKSSRKSLALVEDIYRVMNPYRSLPLGEAAGKGECECKVIKS